MKKAITLFVAIMMIATTLTGFVGLKTPVL